MKTVWKKVLNFISAVLTAAIFLMMLFTIVAVTTFDQQSQTVFGFRMFIVTSDSMKATDFAAGDLIFVKQVKPESLAPGDIISFVSENPDNYGRTVTHKIRSIQEDAQGKLAFQTYGTSSGINDEVPVSQDKLLGRYTMRLPMVGRFFFFLKTTPGYVLFVLLPFLALILYYGIRGFLQFRKYRECEMAQLQKERDSIEAEKQALLQLHLQEQEGEINDQQK